MVRQQLISWWWIKKEHAAVWPSIRVRNEFSDVLPADLDAAIDAAIAAQKGKK